MNDSNKPVDDVNIAKQQRRQRIAFFAFHLICGVLFVAVAAAAVSEPARAFVTTTFWLWFGLALVGIGLAPLMLPRHWREFHDAAREKRGELESSGEPCSGHSNKSKSTKASRLFGVIWLIGFVTLTAGMMFEAVSDFVQQYFFVFFGLVCLAIGLVGVDFSRHRRDALNWLDRKTDE
jgi:cytochrome bd-type quinol oxidase subunit 2